MIDDSTTITKFTEYLNSSDRKPLPLLTLGATEGVTVRYFPSVVNAISERIYIPGGFPFGQNVHSSVYVSAHVLLGQA